MDSFDISFDVVFGAIVGLFNIASGILAFYVYFNLNRIKVKMDKQARRYAEEHKRIKDKLDRCLNELLKEEASLKSRSRLRQELYYIKHSYPNSMKKEIKKINAVIALLDSENIDNEILCSAIDEIIALFMGSEL